MSLDVSTPALLFPAISLLFLAYTNRFLHLSALIRKLHSDWLVDHQEILMVQIQNLRRRISLIRAMQMLGAVSLFLCVVAMLAVIAEFRMTAVVTFSAALLMKGGSLACLMIEVGISGGALKILLNALEDSQRGGRQS